jgi:putative Holliday junction resolvase
VAPGTTGTGVLLAVDLGTVRIGVAASDPHRILASPVETVPRDGTELDRLVQLVAERDVVGVIVGLPTDLRGRDGPAAQAVREWVLGLQHRLDTAAPGVGVSLVDERLTTVVATRRLREAGGPTGRRRKAVIDQEAAVALLQGELDS